MQQLLPLEEVASVKYIKSPLNYTGGFPVSQQVDNHTAPLLDFVA